jgi:hypothetical protein
MWTRGRVGSKQSSFMNGKMIERVDATAKDVKKALKEHKAFFGRG